MRREYQVFCTHVSYGAFLQLNLGVMCSLIHEQMNHQTLDQSDCTNLSRAACL
jgi:hypothetical protein